ncbi:hypothetical protein [Mobiluncus mulieris]|uniref:Uncharacterized protein n=1 Tax=Mobiluncus mulieris TaxID=2052 RepID=A0A7Y0U0T0_9ACTO|nr:hypothetical protein [Mobiluncus mulieris]NMW64378.1 hypothetical protein [Mobiluncus mulieris]
MEEIEKLSPSFNTLPQAAELREARSVVMSKSHLTETKAQAELDRLKPQMLQEWREMIAQSKAQHVKAKAEVANQSCNPNINGISNCPGIKEPTFDDNPSMVSLIGYHNVLIRSQAMEATRVGNSKVKTTRFLIFKNKNAVGGAVQLPQGMWFTVSPTERGLFPKAVWPNCGE